MPVTATTRATGIPKPRNEEWWLRQWQAEQKLWPISQGQGVVVAVIDGGVDAGLPDLKGAVLPGGDIVDGRTDGRTDLDVVRHGTGMATLIAARGHGTGMVGVAPGAKILPVRAVDGTNRTAGAESMGRAIRWAVDNGAQVINMSLGRDSESDLECEPPRQDAVDYALDHDVVIVAGAGNSGHEGNPRTQPAGCPGVLAVGAIDSKGLAAPYTQRHPYVAVAAPGVRVGSERGRGYFDSDLGGTSAATALTSGVAALIRARYPQMPAREVLRRITATAGDVGPKGRDNASGYGRVRPAEALTTKIPLSVPNPVYQRWENSRRHRAAHPLPSRTPETLPEFVSLRTKVIRFGLAGVGLLAIASLMVAVMLLRSRRRTRAGNTDVPIRHARPQGPIDRRR